jgi:hypothetical protein
LNSGGASDGLGAEGVRQQDAGRPQWRRLAPPLIAALVAGIAIAAMLSSQRSSGEGAELASVAGFEIDAAATTMNPAGAKDAVDDARSCRVPLAEITLAAATGTTPTIRVHSGSYVSPSYVLTDQPQRIAIPFPAAYPSGRGVISGRRPGAESRCCAYSHLENKLLDRHGGIERDLDSEKWLLEMAASEASTQ